MAILFPCISNGGSLPDRPLTQGYSEQPSDNVLRSEIDSGPVKQRVRYTGISTKINCQLNLSSIQKQVLYNFYLNTLKYGSLEFEWINFDDGSISIYRFMAPIKINSVVGDQWYINLSLERLA